MQIEPQALGLSLFKVTLKAEPSARWVVWAKHGDQALAKILHRCRGNGCSSIKHADFTVSSKI